MSAAVSASNQILKDDQDLEYHKSLREDREKVKRVRERVEEEEDEKVMREVKEASEREGRVEDMKRRGKEREEVRSVFFMYCL